VKRELETWRHKEISQESINREHLLCYKLERLQDQQNIYWKQRTHNTWLLKGDEIPVSSKLLLQNEEGKIMLQN
jgi:hypothetical protein